MGEARFRFSAGMQDKQKSPPAQAGGPSSNSLQNGGSSDARSEGAVAAGLSASARLRRRTEFARTLQKVAKLRALRFLGLAALVCVFRADELSVNKDMVALPERLRDGFAEAVEGHDAVPTGFRLPLVVPLPRPRAGGRKLSRNKVAGDVKALLAKALSAESKSFGSRRTRRRKLRSSSFALHTNSASPYSPSSTKSRRRQWRSTSL